MRPEIATALKDLAERVAALEKRAADVDRRAEIVAAASRSWRVHAQARDELVLTSDAGDLARLPVAVARVIAAGRALALDVRERDDQVALVDDDGRVVAALSRAAYLALPKALAAWASSSSVVRSATPATMRPAQSQSHGVPNGNRVGQPPANAGGACAPGDSHAPRGRPSRERESHESPTPSPTSPTRSPTSRNGASP